jgi:hypothetical protein
MTDMPGRERGLGPPVPLHGDIPSDLRTSHLACPPKGSAASQQHYGLGTTPLAHGSLEDIPDLNYSSCPKQNTRENSRLCRLTVWEAGSL